MKIIKGIIENTKVIEIADHYGIDNQLHQLAEECSELAVEASHSARKGVTVKIIEEMADVLLMIEQVVYLAEIDMCDIEDCINYKLDRQLERIKGKKVTHYEKPKNVYDRNEYESIEDRAERFSQSSERARIKLMKEEYEAEVKRDKEGS